MKLQQCWPVSPLWCPQLFCIVIDHHESWVASPLAGHPMCSVRNSQWRFQGSTGVAPGGSRVWLQRKGPQVRPWKSNKRFTSVTPLKSHKYDLTESHKCNSVILSTFQLVNYLQHSCSRSCLSTLYQCSKCIRIGCQVQKLSQTKVLS